MTQQEIGQTPDMKMDRRGMLRTVGAGAATAAVAGTVATGGVALSSRPAWAQGLTDADLFNFALNFEYLGAQYYLSAFGQSLSPTLLTGVGTPGAAATGGPVNFQSTAIAQYVQRLAVDEVGHVGFIRAVLGPLAIAQPAIDLVGVWTTIFRASGLIVPGQVFNPYASDVGFLLGAYILEDVCVTALAGAARFVSNKDNVERAAGLLGVEGYQAGSIRTLLANVGAGQVTDSLSAFRSGLGIVGDIGVQANGINFNFANVDSNALVFRRTPRQVLNIAYGAQNASSGGFFPAGVNGTIRS